MVMTQITALKEHGTPASLILNALTLNEIYDFI